jgi:cation transport ATPase
VGSSETSYPFRHYQDATQGPRLPFPAGGTRNPSNQLWMSGETWIALIALLGIGLHLLLRFGLAASSNLNLAPLWFALLAGGVPLLFTLARKLLRGEFGSDLLAGISIVTAVLLGEFLFGVIVVLMLLGGTALEKYAMLASRHAVRKLMLISGDRESEVRYIAKQVGIMDVHFSKSPEEKVEIVRSETKQKTLFLGDGINDAPAMQAATVGVAFGQANDIAAVAAVAVILQPSLSKVDELIHIGRRMRSIALGSAVGGMALSVLGMVAATFGYLPPIGGAIAQEIIDLVAVLNAVRVTLPTKNLTDL